jgi:alkylation response protein AidB-like acyl-CoA dehydrogenase
MTNETNPPAEEEVIIRPTILCRAGRGTLKAVTVDRGDGHTMIVFRSEEEAEAFRAFTGKYPEAEGFKTISVDHEQLAAFLEAHGCMHVAMPEPWDGEGSVTALRLIRLSECSRSACPSSAVRHTDRAGTLRGSRFSSYLSEPLSVVNNSPFPGC